MRFPPGLTIPENVLAIARTLEGRGHETWCVGGAIRDNLLGLENRDVDLATAARPEEVRKLFRRTVPIGVEHGTVAVLDPEGVLHEVTTFRRDVRTDGRHAVVEFGVSLDDDLERRDFTINAIAYHPFRNEWRDPHDGASDLAAGVVRAVGDPARRFQEDLLRIVRALRFAARFDFAIEPATWDAARQHADGLTTLSAERVRDEWLKGLATARRPGEVVRLWDEVGALRRWLPELLRAGGPQRAALDRFDVTDPVLWTCYLSSDPPGTLRRLRCSNAEIERGAGIAQHRDRYPDPTVAAAVRRWMAEVGEAMPDLIAIATADGRDAGLVGAVAAVSQSAAPLTIGALAIGGADVMAAGVGEGPAVGAILRRLLDDVLDNPARNTREYLLDRLTGLAEAATRGDRPAGSP